MRRVIVYHDHCLPSLAKSGAVPFVPRGSGPSPGDRAPWVPYSWNEEASEMRISTGAYPIHTARGTAMFLCCPGYHSDLLLA